METKFGLMHRTCSRFVNSPTDAYLLIERKNSASAKEYWATLDRSTAVAGASLSLPTLQPVIDVCEPLVEIMVNFQVSHKPTIHFVAPMLQHCNAFLDGLASGEPIRDS